MEEANKERIEKKKKRSLGWPRTTAREREHVEEKIRLSWGSRDREGEREDSHHGHILFVFYLVKH